MVQRFYCAQPVLTMLGTRRKNETEAQWGRRFERLQKRFNRLLALRLKIERANAK